MILAESVQRLRALPDADLLRRLGELTHSSRRVEADLVAHIAEVDRRRLYTGEACACMFTNCTERLHLSERQAFLRITAARASRRRPVLLDMLADGRLHLDAIARLAPHLTDQNCAAVLSRAVHRSKREILELVAELSPRPDAPASIRKLPDPRPLLQTVPRAPELAAVAGLSLAVAPGPASALCPDRVAAPRPEVGRTSAASGQHVQPIAPGRYRVQFTADAALREKIERLQALMRTTVPDGDLARVIDAAVTEKLARLEARKFARTGRPRKSLQQTAIVASSRHVPAAVRRAVHERDEGRCAYRDEEGRRCSSRERIEYHHHRPRGYGGEPSVQNVSLFCRAHNAAMAEIDFGSRTGSG